MLAKRARDAAVFRKIPDIEVTVDADWATAKASYRNTTGCFVYWAGMLLDSISNTRPGTPPCLWESVSCGRCRAARSKVSTYDISSRTWDSRHSPQDVQRRAGSIGQYNQAWT